MMYYLFVITRIKQKKIGYSLTHWIKIPIAAYQIIPTDTHMYPRNRNGNGNKVSIHHFKSKIICHPTSCRYFENLQENNCLEYWFLCYLPYNHLWYTKSNIYGYFSRKRFLFQIVLLVKTSELIRYNRKKIETRSKFII